MSQAKLQKLNTFTSSFIFEEIFKLNNNYINPIKLKTFPKEFKLDSFKISNDFNKISTFLVSKYLIQELTILNPKKIFLNFFLLPKEIITVISKAKSNYL